MQEKLVRVHVTGKSKGIVRPVASVHFFSNVDGLRDAIAVLTQDACEDKDVCLFNVNSVESIEVFFNDYNPKFGRRDD